MQLHTFKMNNCNFYDFVVKYVTLFFVNYMKILNYFFFFSNTFGYIITLIDIFLIPVHRRTILKFYFLVYLSSKIIQNLNKNTWTEPKRASGYEKTAKYIGLTEIPSGPLQTTIT